MEHWPLVTNADNCNLAQFDGFNSFSLVSLLALISFLHILSFALGLRNSSEEGIIWILAITYVTIQWRHGLDESIFVLMCLSISSILYFGKDTVYGLGIGMVAVPMLVFWTGRVPSRDYLLQNGSLIGLCSLLWYLIRY